MTVLHTSDSKSKTTCSKVGELTWQLHVIIHKEEWSVRYKPRLEARYPTAEIYFSEVETASYYEWPHITCFLKFANEADEAEFIMRESL